ncbi:MAG: YkoF family thiamine/hydroxymethylpyrimidine-binding protein [Kiritimatiellae bacterium]|nr:YkoF family thiamine/hydroxymethylpyrimidine-binding protein [Kiritimatiellia bacterium]
MNIQAEISLYPLRTAHVGEIIARFTRELRANGLKPETGAMSTMARGECHLVFAAAERAFNACGRDADIVLVLKTSNACPWIRHKKKRIKNA